MSQRWIRSLARQPLLSITVLATLAVGVGVATALFAYLDSFWHPRLAAPAAERVAEVFFGNQEEPRQAASFTELERLRRSTPFADSAAASAIGAALGARDGSRYSWGQFVSGSFFSFLGGRPAAGRLLGPGDDAAGAAPAVVLGYGVWQDDFGGDPAVVGRAVAVNGVPLTVVGVAAREFTGLGYAAGFFIPIAQSDRVSGVARLASAEERWLRVFTRLPRGWSLANAQPALDNLARTLDVEAPLAGSPRRTLLLAATGFDPASRSDPFFQAAGALTAAAILFLLLGCVNVAGLLLARTAARQREWAVRKALGASPGRLLAALFTEIAWPAIGGAIGAIAVAAAIARWLEGMLLTPLGGIGAGWSAPGAHLLALGPRAAVFAVTAAFGSAALALLPPLARVLRDDPNRALRSGDSRAGASLGPRRLLVAAELALAVLLLIGGSLLARSLRAVANANLGFDAHGLSLATLYMPRTAGAQKAAAGWNALLAEIQRLPEVSSATLAHVAPSSGWSRQTRVAAVETPDALRDTQYNLVAPRYFATLGVPILAGRALDERDTPQSPAAVVVSRALAERLFPQQAALGKRLRVAGQVRAGEAGPDFEIVGVAADAATTSAIEPHAPTLYFAYGQRTHGRMTLVMRSAAPLAALEPRLRAALASRVPEAAVIDFVGADQQLERSLHPLRINATLGEGLAALALATAVAGLFALQMFALSLRRREFGVRLALGAQRPHLARLVLGESLKIAALGAAAGIVAAAAATRFLRSLLFGVGALDPWTFLAVPALLLVVVLAAAWLPARRAMRTDPAESLRAL